MGASAPSLQCRRPVGAGYRRGASGGGGHAQEAAIFFFGKNKSKREKKKKNRKRKPFPHTPYKRKRKTKRKSREKQKNKIIAVGEKVEAVNEKKEAFRKQCLAYVGKYDTARLTDFFNYWSEEDRTKGRMRYEGQRYWNLEKRLKRWMTSEPVARTRMLLYSQASAKNCKNRRRTL